MKEKITAIVVMIIIISAVIVNTLFVDKQISQLSEGVAELKIEQERINDVILEANALLEDFQKKERFMSLTVSHENLTTIGDYIIEMRGYLSENDFSNAKITKNRLEYFLENLRRLSGFNFDSII